MRYVEVLYSNVIVGESMGWFYAGAGGPASQAEGESTFRIGL